MATSELQPQLLKSFLNLNGYFIDCDDFQAYEFFMELFDKGTVRFANLLPWLEDHIRPLPNRFP